MREINVEKCWGMYTYNSNFQMAIVFHTITITNDLSQSSVAKIAETGSTNIRVEEMNGKFVDNPFTKLVCSRWDIKDCVCMCVCVHMHACVEMHRLHISAEF